MKKRHAKKKMKLLLVEDDEYVSKAYYFFLSRSGFDVRLVTDGAKVVQDALAFRPAIILLDLIVPGQNGFEILAELKKQPALSDVPVVIISNLCQESDIRECKRLGAADFLVKSDCSMQDVLSKISLLLPRPAVLELAAPVKPKARPKKTGSLKGARV